MSIVRLVIGSAGVAALAVICGSTPALSGEAAGDLTLTIREHRFHPEELRVPAGRKFRVVIHNTDGDPEEFESYDLNRAKYIPAGEKAEVYIGPLSPGRYEFVGELHEHTATGAIVAE